MDKNHRGLEMHYVVKDILFITIVILVFVGFFYGSQKLVNWWNGRRGEHGTAKDKSSEDR